VTTADLGPGDARALAAAPPPTAETQPPSSEDLAERQRRACDARQIEDLARDDAPR
jgi:hypothetical protein